MDSSPIPLCIVNLEILLKSRTIATEFDEKESQLKSDVIDWLKADVEQLARHLRLAILSNGSYILHDLPKHLSPQVETINVTMDDSFEELEHLLADGAFRQDKVLSQLKFDCYCYHLFDEIMTNNLEDDMPATHHTQLPAKPLELLWESLVFGSCVRLKLFNYVRASIMFAHQKVNPTIVNFNKLILLHGPPGTGKTSLCKALAHKFALRCYSHYQNFQLIEINSHSLFSKWFSESGKLVLKLFDGIREFAEDPSNLIFVLIDEVESIAYDRQRSNSSDPTDAIRVVNALLTQIDSIRKYPNVIILATSNVTDAMDNAFVDRADIKEFIGLPSECATFKIYHHCIQELVNSNIIVNTNGEADIFAYNELKLAENTEGLKGSKQLANSLKLLQIAKKSGDFSGRTLRKLPFLAIALFSNFNIPIVTEDYLDYLDKAVEKQIADNKYFKI